MGYTHYWTHRRGFTKGEWDTIKSDVAAIVRAASEDGVTIAGPDGTGGPMFASDEIMFNGDGSADLDHETFAVYHKRKPLESWQTPDRRGWDFCKTERKAYDVAVTAVLCYLESIYPAKFEASSDGHAADWQAGLDLAKRALPRLGNQLHIPVVIQFDSQFSRYLGVGGRNLDAAVRHDGALCIFHAPNVLATFPPEIAPDVWERMKSAFAKLPSSGRINTIGAARDRMLRKFVNAAEQLGGFRAPPL